MSNRILIAAAAVVLSGAAFPFIEARAAAQTFNTAIPAARGIFVYRQQFFHRSAESGSGNRELNVTGSVSVLAYGVNRNLTLFGAVPWLDKELTLRTPGGGEVERGSRGVGDSRLFARQTLFSDDQPGGRTFRIAGYLGLEVPTGSDDESDSLGRLPQPLQSGSGSTDVFAGLLLSRQTLDHGVDARIGYELNRQAHDFEFGDGARLDASFQYRLWPRTLDQGPSGWLNGVLDANLIHRERNEIAGVADDDSGGTRGFLSPGLQYVTQRWVLEGIIQLPVVQKPHGDALEDDAIARAGFRVNF